MKEKINYNFGIAARNHNDDKTSYNYVLDVLPPFEMLSNIVVYPIEVFKANLEGFKRVISNQVEVFESWGSEDFIIICRNDYSTVHYNILENDDKTIKISTKVLYQVLLDLNNMIDANVIDSFNPVSPHL